MKKKLQKYLIDGLEFTPDIGVDLKLLEIIILEGNEELLQAFKLYDEYTIIQTVRCSTIFFQKQLERFTEPQPINSKNLLKVIQEVKSNE